MRGVNNGVPRKRQRNAAKVGRREMAVKLPDITGPLVEFAQLVRAITGEVPRQTAANRGSVSHDTIARMWRGQKVGASVITRFAGGYRVDPNPLLVAAGYKALRFAAPEETGAGFPTNQEIPVHGGEVIVVVWVDRPDVEVEVTPEVKALLSSIGRAQNPGGD